MEMWEVEILYLSRGDRRVTGRWKGQASGLLDAINKATEGWKLHKFISVKAHVVEA